MAIEIEFGAENDIRLARLSQHVISGKPATGCAGNIATDAVGRFPEETESGACKRRQFLGQRLQLSGISMLFGNVAEENRTLFAFDQAGSNRLALLARLDTLKTGRHRSTLGLSRGLYDSAQCQRQIGRRDNDVGVELDQRIVAADSNEADLRVFLGRLTQTLRNQRVVLAQEAANDQGRIQILDFGKLET